MFLKRRNAYMKKTGNGITILPAAKEKIKTGDVHYRFRQDNDFYYLTGFDEPDAVAVFAPNHPKHRYILFVRPKIEAAELWTGKRYGTETAVKQFGADMAYSLEDLDTQLPQYFEGHEKLYYRLGEDESFDRKLISWLGTLRQKYRMGKTVPLDIHDPSRILSAMRVCKSQDEIQKMEKAQYISAQGFMLAMRTIEPGMYEYQIAALLEHCFTVDEGMGSGYAIIVASRENGTVLHYTSHDRRMNAGELVVIDAGAEYDYYNADITRTIPVAGKFSPLQRDVYNIVLEAQMAAIEQVKPGSTVEHVHRAALKILTKGLIKLKVIDGPLNSALKKKTYQPFYMHGTSHFLGMDVHDVGAMRQKNSWIELAPGMVLTVEPGLYFSPRIKGLPKRFHGLAVRIEDDILVTGNGYRNLTPPIPKTVAEIENFMK